MTQKKKKYDFWFSQEQKDKGDRKEKLFAILENGDIVEYTQASLVGSDLSCSWKEDPVWEDAVFLGVGVWHHNE